MQHLIPSRSHVDPKYTWNAESVFPGSSAWESAAQEVLDHVSDIKKFEGQLKEGPAVLVEALNTTEDLLRQVGLVNLYGGFSHAVDTTDQQAAAMADKAQGIFGKVLAAISFVNPELIAIGESTLRQWMGVEPRLAIYEHYVHNLFRKQAHVRSADIEEVLGMLAAPFSGPANAFSMLTNADFKFEPAVDSRGDKFEVRGKALGVNELHLYDMWAPLIKNRPGVPYEQAVEWICAGLAPMGEEYVSILRKGCLEDRWVDVYPNQGKQMGAFSWGVPGTYPFIMMSYTDGVFSLSTLAHELGHSMHSYLTWKHQPFVYMEYATFVAEVASNFHQAMVRAHLLATNPERDFQIAVIEEAMTNFFRYFFTMPILARFELETHELVEKGEALTADTLVTLMADLLVESAGGKVQIDRARDGMYWATFPHLFSDYYVFQYVTGISAAHALARRILRGEPRGVEDYLDFLKTGSSMYSLDVLKKAGVDLSAPEPIEEAFAVMGNYIERLDKLLRKKG